jgi:hypothetical protein
MDGGEVKAFRCDGCMEWKAGTPKIATRGVPRKSGIMIPDFFFEAEFCSAECFWKYVKEQMPDSAPPAPSILSL